MWSNPHFFIYMIIKYIMKIFIIGFLFVSLIGTFLHFLYDISNHNKMVGVFSSVNESTWEHIKLALTPTFIYSLIDGYAYGCYDNYFFAKLVSVLTIIIVMPLLFYITKLFLKKHITIINILIFLITAFISELLMYKLLFITPVSYIVQYVSLVLLFILFACYLLLTVFPIESVIFKDPITQEYGFDGHRFVRKLFILKKF